MIGKLIKLGVKREISLLSSLTCQEPSTASHTNLLTAKLSAYGFDMKSTAFLSAYLKKRKLNTKIGSTFSECLNILFDVPRGSILGPLLSLIFIADLTYLNCNLDFASYAGYATSYICPQIFYRTGL